MYCSSQGGTVFKRLPLLPAAGMPQASEAFVEGSLGYILVEIKLSMTKKTIFEQSTAVESGPQKSPGKMKELPPAINVKTQVQSASEYSTVFPCEAVARSIMTQKVPTNVEQFHVAAGHEGLVFFGHDYKSSSSVDMKEKASQALLHQFQRQCSCDGVDGIEYHVFENQRRVFLEWGARNLMSFERTAYTEESGTTSCPFTNHDVKFKPPKGYVWQEDSRDQWLVDKEYTNTDEDGWVYGTDFGYVMQNLRLGVSTTSSQLRSVRRRRWKRVAVKAPSVDETVDGDASANSNGDAKQVAAALASSENEPVPEVDAKHETFHVFYNQRRAVLTLSFGPGNLFPTDRFAFTDDSGMHSYPHCTDIEDMKPPTGYQWVEGSKWKTDQDYTDTDEFGWSYA
jgi:hypothetical protein